MKLLLDHTQRLNVHAVLGAQRGSVDEIRAIWKLQDRIDLSAKEREAINYRSVPVNGMQQTFWDITNDPPKEFELTTDEFARINAAVKSFGMASGNDRRWLEPLLSQLELIEKNIEKKKTKQSDAAD